MKIALLDVTVTTSYGGIQTAIWELSRALHDLGHEVTVFGGRGSILPDLCGRNITVKTFDFTSRENALNLGNRFKRLWERWTFALHAKRDVIAGKFDWVVITKPYDFFWPHLMPKNSSTKFAFRSGGTSFIAGDRFLSRRISAFFSNSYFNAWQINERYKRFPKVIYNGVDLVRFGPHHRSDSTREELGLNIGDILCVFAGRLVGWKGVKYSIMALTSQLLSANSVYLLIIGDGPEKSSLINLARSLNISNRVIFKPAMAHEELPKWWASADIGVFASISDEGFSNSMAEALASGLPVIATAFSGNPETVGNEGSCGTLVPPEDSESIAAAINLIATNSERRRSMSLAARRRIEDNFTWVKVAQRLLDGLQCSTPSTKETS
jgi:glycosyltransferase involved in cell wall biosynthesis